MWLVENMFPIELFNSTTIIAIGAALLACIAYWYLTMPRGIPPGPLGLPIVGYAPFLQKETAKVLSKLSEKYGGIMSLYLGSILVVVLNDIKAIKEALVDQAENFSGRPRGIKLGPTNTTTDDLGIVKADGQFWNDHRRFSLHILRDCGFGKSSLEPLIMDEIQHFLKEVEENKINSEEFRDILYLSVANNICLMVLGRRFDYNDQWMLEFKRNLVITVKKTTAVGPMVFFPWIKYLPGINWLLRTEEAAAADLNMTKSVEKLIEDSKKEHSTDNRENYFNAFLAEQKTRLLKDPKDKTFSDEAFADNLKTFLAAGTETSSSTLIWFLQYMMAYPQVQRKVQKEIDDVIGSDRMPSCQDMTRTPYIQATIAEVQRITTLVPLSIPHRNKEECYVQGYRIPKDTFILPNLWHVHNDKNLFPDELGFRPERFLNDKGQFEQPENMIVFSLGKRRCLGEPLARMELYLYATAMLQKFNFKLPLGVTASFEAQMTAVSSLKQFLSQPVEKR